MASIGEEFKRQQQLAELDSIEAERQNRVVSRQGTSRLASKRHTYLCRWIASILSLAVAISFLVDDGKVGESLFTLVLAALINPFSFEWIKGCLGKVFRK